MKPLPLILVSLGMEASWYISVLQSTRKAHAAMHHGLCALMLHLCVVPLRQVSERRGLWVQEDFDVAVGIKAPESLEDNHEDKTDGAIPKANKKAGKRWVANGAKGSSWPRPPGKKRGKKAFSRR